MAHREDKKRAVREALVRTARNLFMTRGYESVTIEDVAREAGVSKRTVFRYFPSKMDLVFPDHEERLRRFQEALAAHANPEKPLRGVLRALEAYADYYQREREALLAEYHLVGSSREVRGRDADLDWQFQTALFDALERAGLPRRRARAIGGLVFGAIRALIFDWLSEGCREDLREVSRDLFVILETTGDAIGQLES